MGHRARASRFSLVVLFLAASILGLASAGLGAMHAAYSGIEVRDAARSPVSAAEGESAAFLYREVHDSMVGTPLDASVVYLWPLVEDAPLPPGVEQWPAPGEAVLSPALREMGAEEGLDSRYGRVAGTIGPEGLATGGEALAYVVPREMPGEVRENFMTASVGYGAGGRGTGEVAEMVPFPLAASAYVLTVGVSAVILGVIAVAQGREGRQRQNMLLFTLGYTWRERLRWMAAQVRLPLLGAVALSGTVVALAGTCGLRLPGMGVGVSAGDLRVGLPVILGAMLLAWLAFLVSYFRTCLVVPRNLAVNRPRAREREFSPRRALVCFLAAPAAVGVLVAVQRTGSELLFFVYLAALLVVVFTLFDLVGYLMLRASTALRRWGGRRRSPAAIVGAAGIVHRIRPVAVLGVSVAACLLVGTQVQGFLVSWAEGSRVARVAHEEFRDSVVEISSQVGFYAGSEELLPELARQAPGATIMLTQTACGESGCVPRSAMFEPGDAPVERAYLRYLFGSQEPQQARLEELLADQDRGEVLISVVYPEGRAADLRGIKETVARETVPMWRTWSPATSDYYGASMGARQASWVGYFGLIGLGVMLCGILVVLLSDVAVTMRRMGPLVVLSDSGAVLRGVALVRLGVPVVLGFVVGGGMALMLSSALALSFGSSLSYALPFLLLCAVVVGLGLAVAAAVSFYRARTIMKGWKVGTWVS
ncbi:hypothetical protein V5S96_10785 [Corynebacterium mastitidis]|uniref:ABC transporter permease n=1 Tax=Corynebacterium mastitidis TaxID=161890 RepID=A0ABU8P2U9_9CORY